LGIHKSKSNLEEINWSKRRFLLFVSLIALSRIYVLSGFEIVSRDLAIVVYNILYAQKTLYWCTDLIDFMSFDGPMTQPEREPVAPNIFPPE
jgi:hypothetical protein